MDNIIYHDIKTVSEEDTAEYYKLLKQMDQTAVKLDPKQLAAEVTLPSKVVGVVFIGDWHVGAHGVDYELLDRDLKLIKDTEGVFAIGMGDYKDNQNPNVHGSGVFESITSPAKQDDLVRHLIQEVGPDKWIALIRGCHDDWDKKLSDKDFVQDLCDAAGCVNLWHGGSIKVNVGTQSYTIFARHKYKYDSSLNTTNSQRNLVNNFGAFDIVALAHKHYPDVQVTHRMDQEIVYLRSGTYKHHDEFGQKIGGYKGIYGTPLVILFPKDHKKLVVPDIKLGVKILKALRR